jgi:heme/copper-type cytochrome/quinol oxidase subunit 2
MNFTNSTNNKELNTNIIILITFVLFGVCLCCIIYIIYFLIIYLNNYNIRNNDNPKKKLIEILFGSVISPNLFNTIFNHIEIQIS